MNNETQNVLLECALLKPAVYHRSCSSSWPASDAYHRYERGVHPALQHKAMERATRCTPIDICGGEAGPVIDITNEATLPKRNHHFTS
ncbi:phenylalanine--tRNA ligase beta subunit-related protein [Shigella flexneri]